MEITIKDQNIQHADYKDDYRNKKKVCCHKKKQLIANKQTNKIQRRKTARQRENKRQQQQQFHTEALLEDWTADVEGPPFHHCQQQ